jgi:hypothetical protein
LHIPPPEFVSRRKHIIRSYLRWVSYPQLGAVHATKVPSPFSASPGDVFMMICVLVCFVSCNNVCRGHIMFVLVCLVCLGFIYMSVNNLGFQTATQNQATCCVLYGLVCWERTWTLCNLSTVNVLCFSYFICVVSCSLISPIWPYSWGFTLIDRYLLSFDETIGGLLVN